MKEKKYKEEEKTNKLVDNRNYHLEIIKDNPAIVQTPYKNLINKHQPLNFSDSRQSLLNDSHFIPITKPLSPKSSYNKHSGRVDPRIIDSLNNALPPKGHFSSNPQDYNKIMNNLMDIANKLETSVGNQNYEIKDIKSQIQSNNSTNQNSTRSIDKPSRATNKKVERNPKTGRKIKHREAKGAKRRERDDDIVDLLQNESE